MAWAFESGTADLDCRAAGVRVVVTRRNGGSVRVRAARTAGTWSTAVVAVRYAVTLGGEAVDFATPKTITAAAPEELIEAADLAGCAALVLSVLTAEAGVTLRLEIGEEGVA